jgi:CheY-like chemotaxis protein
MPAGGRIIVDARNMVISDKHHQKLPPGRYVRISFSDTGIGIPREILSRIFDPFFTTKQKGSGLGLATSFSIINRHNGSLEVESEPGKGSTFHITLPATEEINESITKPPKSHQGSGRILVMDDEKLIRDIIVRMLQSMGYTVLCAKDGKEAIDILEKERKTGLLFLAIVADLTVPGGMGGEEMARRIREYDTTIKIFVTSGYAEDPIMANPTTYGFTACLRKLFMKTELAELFERYMKN